MKLLSPVISKLARMRIWRINNWINHPVQAQRGVLQDLVIKDRRDLSEGGARDLFACQIEHDDSGGKSGSQLRK